MADPNLVDSFRFPHIPFKLKVAPTKEEIQRFFDALDSEFSEALFLFYASSGLRKGEVLGLSEEDIDFKKRMVVPNGHSGVNKISYVSFYNREAEEALSKIDLNKNKPFRISDRQYKKLWRNAKGRSGIHVTAQRLREWFCCEMGNLGIPDRYIDAFCGRAPKSVLARHYTDYSPERLKKIYDEANLKVLI